MIIRPPRLKKGDLIGIVAPASPQRDDQLLKNGIRYFESFGYNVECGKHLWKRNGYLAGTDDERAEDLNDMIHNDRVKMIIAGRGGYGVTRILDRIDYRHLKRHPKIIAGFSDLTALCCAIYSQASMISITGAMPGVDFNNPESLDPFAEESFWRAVTSTKPLGKIKQSEPITSLHKGTANGRLFCANLTLLTTLCGTKYIPTMRESLLLIEEIGEEAYRVDRHLSQLYNAGVLKSINGLLFGAFTQSEPTRVSVESLPMETVFREYVTRMQAPALSGVQFGHIKTKLTLPFGVQARMNGSTGTVTLLESGVS